MAVLAKPSPHQAGPENWEAGRGEITTVVPHNLVGIGLTDLPKSGLGSIAPLPPVPMALSSGAYSITASQVRHKEPHAHVTICQKSQKDEDILAEKHKLPKKENRKIPSHNFLAPFSQYIY